MATAQELIADARSFANDIMGQAHNWLGSATTIASSYYQPISKELLSVQKLDVTGFAVGEVPTFSASFNMPLGEPTMGSLTPLYVPSLPSFGDRPEPLNTSNLFQMAAPTLNLPEFDGVFPDITTDWAIPTAPVIAFPAAPTITPLDLQDVNLTLPTILDPEVFSETYSAPTSSVVVAADNAAYCTRTDTARKEFSALDPASPDQALATYKAILGELTALSPAALQADWTAVNAAVQAATSLEELSKLGTGDLDAATKRIDTWSTENCGFSLSDG